MKPIGGYFELELAKGVSDYHDTPYVLKSGRSALHFLFTVLRPSMVYIPYYTCDALLEPFVAAGVPYTFYEINERLEPKHLPDLKPGEYFLYINYLDLKRDTIAALSARYGDKFIADCTQAFFMKGNGLSWFFNSCRKFFGVPDGSYLYAPAGKTLPEVTEQNENYITDHLVERFNGHPQEGYELFAENEVLAGSGIARMSKLSEYLLSQVSYEDVAVKRRQNYLLLHERFSTVNLFDAAPCPGCVPMSYPFLPAHIANRAPLFAAQLFIPTFWKDTLSRIPEGFELEKDITRKLLPLPVDHRYGPQDMAFMTQALIT